VLKKVLLAGAVALASFPVCASQLPDYPFIHAKGTAFLFVAPDMGEIDFDIHAEDAAPDVLASTLQARIEEVQHLLVDQGLSADDVDVRNVQKSMGKSAKADGQVDVYIVKCAVHIVVRDLSKWRDVLSPLLDKPNIDSLEVNFGTTDRSKLTQELMGSAVRDARTNAEAMASGFGKHAGAVTAMTSGELKNLSTSIGLVPGDFYLKEMEQRGDESKSKSPNALLNISLLKMYQSVDVIFRIK